MFESYSDLLLSLFVITRSSAQVVPIGWGEGTVASSVFIVGAACLGVSRIPER